MVSQQDKQILRELGQQIAEIGNLPVQKETAALWRKLNALQRTRPLIWIDEIPWWELSAADPDALNSRCEDAFLRGLEGQLRRTLYQWRHFRGDMVVEPVVTCPMAWASSGFGIRSHAVRSADGGGSADFEPVITTEDDIEKIQFAAVTHDVEETRRREALLGEVFDGLLPVRTVGFSTRWCAPWDVLVSLTGITELMIDMLDRPDFVTACITRMMDVLLDEADQFAKLGLWTVTSNNHRVGSGGLGITDQLPQPDYAGGPARTMDIWGTSTGQIFSEVSPDMHWEFCLKHEMRWLERFGLNCYGCCEPLHKKIHLMRRIPRLRRVSMSPWINLPEAAEAMGRDFIFSSKPNPAFLATDDFDADLVARELRKTLDATRGNVVELILKDISTVRNDPPRLDRWAEVAMEVAREY